MKTGNHVETVSTKPNIVIVINLENMKSISLYYIPITFISTDIKYNEGNVHMNTSSERWFIWTMNENVYIKAQLSNSRVGSFQRMDMFRNILYK